MSQLMAEKTQQGHFKLVYCVFATYVLGFYHIEMGKVRLKSYEVTWFGDLSIELPSLVYIIFYCVHFHGSYRVIFRSIRQLLST